MKLSLPSLDHSAMTHLGLFLSCLLLAAYWDVKTWRIPNWCSFGALGLGILSRLWNTGLSGGLEALSGVVIVGGPPACLFWTTRGRALGGGDVKILAAVGAWLGPSAGLEVELAGLLLLTAFASIREAKHGRLQALLSRSLQLTLPLRRRRSERKHEGSCSGGDAPEWIQLRFGPALVCGALLLILWENWGALP